MRKLCAVLATVYLASSAPAATTVWVDTDVSIGSPIREVDDAYALVLAFHSPEIQIAGLSTTYGNAPLSHTTHAAQDMVRRFGGPAGLTVEHVFAGARFARDLGRSPASDALAFTLRKHKVTYIALGPLTNLAAFLALHPKAANRIERVILVGGQEPGASLALGPTRSFHIHDANVFKDSAATWAVLRSNIPLTLVPIATASNLLLDGTDFRQFERSSGAANYLAQRSRIWLWFCTHVVKTQGGPVFDALAIIPVTRPELLSTKRRYARMDAAGNLIVTDRLTSGSRLVQYCTGLVSQTKLFVLRRIMARQSRE